MYVCGAHASIYPRIHPSTASTAAENKWVEPTTTGEAPGACNMHTSDYMPEKRKILVFRGGDGQAYLNDLHTLDVETFECVSCVSAGLARSPWGCLVCVYSFQN